MSLAILSSRAAIGIQAPAVRVEVHVSGGLPALTIVGLPEAAVREAKDRVRAALQNSGFQVPPRRITINLAPADLPKDGGRFDLPIAIGILIASGQLTPQKEPPELLGELSLSGKLQPVQGVLPAVVAAAADDHGLLLPGQNAREAGLADNGHVALADHLLEVCAGLRGERDWPAPAASKGPSARKYPDFADVRGQDQAKRALLIAAAGSHNLLMLGPPGCGKSMLAHRFPGLLPPLGVPQALELASLQSASQQGFDQDSWRQPPFRSPHHGASAVALIGGGSRPKPGEISLAHHGCLFLDELPEFQRPVLEMLREPLETGEVAISRAACQVRFPARFQLVAAMNPCPCGALGDPGGACRCSADQVQRYRGKLSGPLLDRVDMHVFLPKLPARALLEPAAPGISTASLRASVIAARERQQHRQQRLNAHLPEADLIEVAALGRSEQALLSRAAESLGLSARACRRVQKLARTIADLAAAPAIDSAHLAEALQYRALSSSTV